MLKEELEKLQVWELRETKTNYAKKISKAVKKAQELNIEIEALREVFNSIDNVQKERYMKEEEKKETAKQERHARLQELAIKLTFNDFLKAVDYVEEEDHDETEWFELHNFYHNINSELFMVEELVEDDDEDINIFI